MSGELDGASRLSRLRPAMGTLCSIAAAGDDMDLEGAINVAFQSLQQVDQLMHPQHGVDLSRINQRTNQCVSQIIPVHEWTWRVLQLAKQINELSNGVFDPCLPSKTGCMRDVELFSDHQVICHAPVMMDLGGIAKGFAVDCAIDALKVAGCSSGLVNAGGDVRVFGEMQHMYIKHADQVLPFELCDQALAVSELNHADRPAEHQGYYHRGSPTLPLHQQIAVVAERAVIADALTKCVMWCDQAISHHLCATFNVRILLPLI